MERPVEVKIDPTSCVWIAQSTWRRSSTTTQRNCEICTRYSNQVKSYASTCNRHSVQKLRHHTGSSSINKVSIPWRRSLQNCRLATCITSQRPGANPDRSVAAKDSLRNVKCRQTSGTAPSGSQGKGVSTCCWIVSDHDARQKCGRGVEQQSRLDFSDVARRCYDTLRWGTHEASKVR